MADDKKRAKAKAANMDPRFAAVAKDPRFHKFPQSQKKVEIDPRFAGEPWATNLSPIHQGRLHTVPFKFPWQASLHSMVWSFMTFSNAGMFSNPDFQNVARVDKRGRKVSKLPCHHAHIARHASSPCMQTQLVACSARHLMFRLL